MSERHPPPGFVGTASRPFSPTAPLPWERFFPTLPPDVQHALLTRAAAGGLTAADLPTAHAPTPARLLALDPAELPRFDAPPADPVAAAVACPDLYLADAPPGPDRLPFAAAVAAAVARGGCRVLVVADPADADAVVARLADDPTVLVARGVGADEDETRLPLASARRTARGHTAAVATDARTRAAAAVGEADSRLAALRAAFAAVPPTAVAADRLAALGLEIAAVEREREALPAAVAESDAPFADAHAAELARLDAEAQKLAAELTLKSADLDAARDHCAAKKAGVLSRFVGLFARGEDGKPTDPALATVEECVAALQTAAARLAAERSRVLDEYRTGREQRAAAEVIRRGAGLTDRLAALTVERGRVATEFRRGCDLLAGVGGGVVDAESAAAVDRAAAPLVGLAERAEAEARFAREWSAELTARGPELADRLLALVRVVVAPLSAAGLDPLVPAAAGGSPPFDRVVVANTDHLSDADVTAAARLAPRWVLVGDAAARPAYVRPARGGLFRRLWAHLHRQPWAAEGVRLVARLATPDPQWRGEFECEPLADQPDIELRFAPAADGRRAVCEVAFPPTASAADARSFLARELGEVRLCPLGPVHWHVSDDRVVACWPAAGDDDAADWADLAPGVREKVVGPGAGARTAAVAFDAAAGWDRATAAEWLAARLPTPRTAAVARPAGADRPAPRLVAGAVG